jgi:N-methylhydantoinase A/oxoprolinase/acetone carboxylase beta subunit
MDWGLSIVSAGNENIGRYWRDGNSIFTRLPANGSLKDNLEDGLMQIAAQMDINDVRSLFRGKGIIGLSTSYFLDLIREGKGQKIGIILNDRTMDALSEEEKQYLPLTGDNIAYISASVAESDPDEVIKAYRDLLKVGVHSVVIALKNSSDSPGHERHIKEILTSRYPGRYLGGVPVYISSDFKTENAERDSLNLCIFNAYAQAGMRSYFFDMEQNLKSFGYRGTLFAGNRYGKISRWDKTRAIDTSDSVFRSAMTGAKALARRLAIKQALVLNVDSGGACLGVIDEGEVCESDSGTVLGIPVSAPSAEGVSVSGSAVSAVTEAGLRFISGKGLDVKNCVLIPANKNAVSICGGVGSAMGVKEVYTSHSSEYLSAFGLSITVLNHLCQKGDASIKGLDDPEIILGVG